MALFKPFGLFSRKIYNKASDSWFMVAKNPIPRELFDILACPICKSDLKYNKEKTKLICAKCKAKYPIREGIPILLPQNKR